jgi:hypothetical protein
MDTISGGFIPADGVVRMAINGDKVGYIILPNKTVLTTSSGEIDTTNTGKAGKLTFYIPRDSSNIRIEASDLSGSVIFDGDSQLSIENCADLISVIADNTKNLVTYGCSLTAKSIGDILINAYEADQMECYYDFSGGLNADITAIGLYVEENGHTISSIMGRLVDDNDGTILYNY